jgi:hypothetical protein
MNELRNTTPFFMNMGRTVLVRLPLWRRVRAWFFRPILRIVEQWLR